MGTLTVRGSNNTSSRHYSRERTKRTAPGPVTAGAAGLAIVMPHPPVTAPMPKCQLVNWTSFFVTSRCDFWAVSRAAPVASVRPAVAAKPAGLATTAAGKDT